MSRQIAHSSHSPLVICHRHRCAFSFAEVMFAVVILGVGFIMVAAIFPVAIQQSQTTAQEGIAAAISRQAVNTMISVPKTTPSLESPLRSDHPTDFSIFPPTIKYHVPGAAGSGVIEHPPAVVVPFTGARWALTKANFILPDDSRYAYVPFYKRENNSPVAQLIVVAVEVRNRSTYDPAVDVNYYPAIVKATVTQGSFAQIGTATTITPAYIAINGGVPHEGDSVLVPLTVAGASMPRGRTYRLGRQTVSGTFELDAADGLSQADHLSGGAGNDGYWATSDDAFDNLIVSKQVQLYPTLTLQPSVAYAAINYYPGSAAGRIQLFGDQLNPAVKPPPQTAAPGAFVIIADDYPFDPSKPAAADYPLPRDTIPADSTPASPINYPFHVGALNGRIFRLGAAIPTNPGLYDLDPAYGMRGGPGADSSPDTVPNTALVNRVATAKDLRAKVYIIGVGKTDPTVAPPNETYTGAVQDIAVYTTIIPAQ